MNISALQLGPLVNEGKTKLIYATDRPGTVLIRSKDDITAGDGAKHDVIDGKAALATRTTCNVFTLLKACGIPVAFEEQCDDISFLAPKCAMLPYEVIIRREAHGSFLRRSPRLVKGFLFPRLICEFFLKTKDRKWKEHGLVCDDPFMSYAAGSDKISLFDPHKPIRGQEPFLVLDASEVFGYEEEWKLFPEMERLARRTFHILEKAWQLQGRTLVDFKVEFGLTASGTLLLADVIDNDSWRLLDDGSYIDKQVYRDGGALDLVAAKFRLVADATDAFALPKQKIVLWRGSERDELSPFYAALGEFKSLAHTITCSAHKEPEKAMQLLHDLEGSAPGSVIIAYVGRSNGLGPTLAANTALPVISVPASVRDFPDDIWSSLRMPSEVPNMTVLEPANAVRAALNILALRNPSIYAHLMMQLEERRVNRISI